MFLFQITVGQWFLKGVHGTLIVFKTFSGGPPGQTIFVTIPGHFCLFHCADIYIYGIEEMVIRLPLIYSEFRSWHQTIPVVVTSFTTMHLQEKKN